MSTLTSTSMGDVWSDIEHITRLLEENRAATSGVFARKRQLLEGPITGSMKEHKWLNERFNTLSIRREELQEELQRLIVVALKHQIKGGKGRPGTLY